MPAIPFPAVDAKVPIVGQSIQPIGYTLSAAFVCVCDHPTPLLVSLTQSVAVGAAERTTVRCPSCQRVWACGPRNVVGLHIAEVATPDKSIVS